MNKALRELADIYYGKSPTEVLAEDGVFPIVGTGGVYGKAKQSMFNGPSVVVGRKGSLGNPMLMVEPFWPVDTTYAVVPKNGTEARWLFYNLDQFDLTKLNEATGVPSISRDWLYRITFDDPGTSAQKKIGDILETIDNSIERTEVLIAKYRQIKAGLMHDLFARGVTKDGKLRPPREEAPELYKKSPIGWIPREWEVNSIEAVLENIIDYRGKTPLKTNEGIPLITAKNIRKGFIDPYPLEYISEKDYVVWMTRGIPNLGDILFTTEAPLGNVAQIVTLERLAFAQRVIILQPSSNVQGIFLKYLLMSNRFQAILQQVASGTTALGIKQSTFRELLITLPNVLKEQTVIAAYLQKIDSLIDQEVNTRNKQEQTKQGLMHDLLTGRVRVNV